MRTVGLTPGGGIGPEVLAKGLAALPPDDDTRFVFFGHADTLRRAPSGVDMALTADGLRVGPHHVRLVPPAGRSGLALERDALLLAVGAAQAGEVDALVTGPIHKAALQEVEGGPYPGHTEFLFAHLARGPRPLMLFAGGPFVLGLATIHVPLRDVPAALTAQRLDEILDLLGDATQHIAGRRDVTIAVLGLNPHAGEGGLLGDEEQTVVGPVLQKSRPGLTLRGPLPADGFFADVARGAPSPDAVLALYHDQGLAPYKLLTKGAGVNITWGLDVVRTSPDHGTADALVGTGQADPASMRAALDWALRLTP